MSHFRKTYLGDAVYVDLEDDFVVLTVENGREVIHTTYLDPEVMGNLIRWYEHLLASSSPRHVQS